MTIADIAKHTWLTKATFALLGTNALIGWSAVLSSFDFFSAKYPKGDYPDVAFFFPIPLKVGSFIWTFAMGYIMKRISLKIRISGFIAIQAVLMIMLPIIATYMQSEAGYALMIITCFLIGSTACIVQNSNLALVATFDKESLRIYWIFTSLTALLMNLGRVIVLLIFGDNQEGIDTGIYVYYAMADLIMVITIVCLLKFLKSQFYFDMEEIRKLQQKSEEETLPESSDLNLNASSTQSVGEQLIQKKPSQLKFVLSCFMKVKYIALSIFIEFIVQYMLFPGVAVFQKQYHLISSHAWAILTMQIVYSVGDLCGKYLSSFSFYSLNAVYAINFSRFIFFFTFLMIAHDDDSAFFQNDYFAFVNIFLLSCTNGFCTGGFMTIGPTNGQTPEERGIISMIQGFFLTFGIAVGTFLALTLSN